MTDFQKNTLSPEESKVIFKQYNKSRRISNLLQIILVIIVLPFIIINPPLPYIIILFVICGIVIISIRYVLHCPKCKEPSFGTSLIPTYCTGCGIKTEGKFRCSNCGLRFWIKGSTGNPNYCSNCGVKLRE